MKNIFNPIYREDYLMGYSNGFNPHIDFIENATEAYCLGFEQGRKDYESMNGKIIHGIPKLIVTNKVLEDFLLAGMLGMDINEDGYTAYQLEVIQRWYQSGIEKYDPSQGNYLIDILEEKGIELPQ